MLQGAEDWADEKAIEIVNNWLWDHSRQGRRSYEPGLMTLTDSTLDDLANAIADTIREVAE